MNCNTTHYRANSSSVPGDPTGSLIIYIILWLVIPEATNTAEKLEMKGEKVDLNSIKASVVGEMKGMQQRAEKFGQEAKTFAEEKGRVVTSDVKLVAKRTSRSLGDVIILLLKIFAYFIIGCVSFGLVVALFAFAIFSIGVFPLKDFVLNDQGQNALAWGTLLFFIAVPVIGIITWIIRRLAKMKSNRRTLRFTFISLWIIGWCCFIGLIASVARDFRSVNNINEQEIVLNNPQVAKLELTTNSPDRKYYRSNFFRLEPFEGLEDDTAFVKNMEIKILKSPNDSFRVTMLRMANGRTRRYADTLANMINFDVRQVDSLLVLDKGIAITRQSKFRNQHVIITVFVPVGKQIRINRNVGWGREVRFGPWGNDNFDIDIDEEEMGWHHDEDYVMKADGLYNMSGERVDNDEYRHPNRRRIHIDDEGVRVEEGNDNIIIDKNGVKVEEKKDTYRYDNTAPITVPAPVDSTNIRLEQQRQKTRDSLRKVKENIDQQLEKISAVTENRDKDYTPMSQLQSYSLLVNMD